MTDTGSCSLWVDKSQERSKLAANRDCILNGIRRDRRARIESKEIAEFGGQESLIGLEAQCTSTVGEKKSRVITRETKSKPSGRVRPDLGLGWIEHVTIALCQSCYLNLDAGKLVDSNTTVRGKSVAEVSCCRRNIIGLCRKFVRRIAVTANYVY